MRLATAEEAKYATHQYQYEVAPWAAGKPGTMFDNPSDVLYCDFGGPYQHTGDWCKANNVHMDMFYSATNWTTQHYAGFSGYMIQISQSAGQLCFYRDCEDFDQITAQLNAMLPLMKPVARQVKDWTTGSIEPIVIMGKMFQVFEPDLCGPTIWYVYESDGEWLLVDLNRIVQKYATMQEMLEDCKKRFYWVAVGQSDREEEESFW